MEQLKQWEQAARGLYLRSETDAPFEVLNLGKQEKSGFQQEQLKHLLQVPADTLVEVVELPCFLQTMTKAPEGARPERVQEAQQFQQLQELLLAQLEAVKVYRVGSVEIDAYLLGWTPDEHLVGLKTHQVET